MPRFTTRDWFWFCIVMGLAIGWGSHFRYSSWIEYNLITAPRVHVDPVVVDALRGELNTERKRTRELVEELTKWNVEGSALVAAIRSVCNEQQRRELKQARQEHIDQLRQLPSGAAPWKWVSESGLLSDAGL